MNNRLFKNTIAVIVTVIMVFSFSVLSFAKEKVDLTKYFTPQKLEELEKVYTVEELEKMLEVELENDKKIHENAKSRILIHLEKFDERQISVSDVNFDKKVNAIDARIILRVSARLETLPN